MRKQFLVRVIIFILLTVIAFIITKILDVKGEITIPLWLLLSLIFLIILVIPLILKNNVLLRKENTNYSETKFEKKKQLKQVPSKFELSTITNKTLEWTVYLHRSFYPNQKPDIETFLSELIIDKSPICNVCKSDLTKRDLPGHMRLGYVWKCSNKKCDTIIQQNKKSSIEYYSGQLEPLKDESLNEFKRKIRSGEFDKYWNKYVEIYDTLTNKKYDDYFQPYLKDFNRR